LFKNPFSCVWEYAGIIIKIVKRSFFAIGWCLKFIYNLGKKTGDKSMIVPDVSEL
jgi:hypothetical protein